MSIEFHFYTLVNYNLSEGNILDCTIAYLASGLKPAASASSYDLKYPNSSRRPTSSLAWTRLIPENVANS
jgi:hypothetical protein